MSIPQFNQLSNEERKLLYDAPAIITLLVGSADDNLDSKEISTGLRMVMIRKDTGDKLLKEYYEVVNGFFDNALFRYSSNYEKLELEERISKLSEILAGLNEILPKIDPLYAKILIKSLRTFAKEIAEASGGIAGIASISNAEQQLISLHMIDFE
jgi:hypothetical protein